MKRGCLLRKKERERRQRKGIGASWRSRLETSFEDMASGNDIISEHLEHNT